MQIEGSRILQELGLQVLVNRLADQVRDPFVCPCPTVRLFRGSSEP